MNVNNFKVDSMIAAPGGTHVEISTAFEGRLPGFYYVNVVPVQMETWKQGVHVFAIAVQRGLDKEQTLVAVHLD